VLCSKADDRSFVDSIRQRAASTAQSYTTNKTYGWLEFNIPCQFFGAVGWEAGRASGL